VFPAVSGHQRQKLFAIFFEGLFPHPFDFNQSPSVVGQTDGYLNQDPLMEDLKLRNILFLCLAGTPLFKLLE